MTSGWQPIETVPKDGTIVDLWGKETRRPGDGRTIPVGGHFERFADCVWMFDPRARGIIAGKSWVQVKTSKLVNPTHWMPLPPPPTEDGKVTTPQQPLAP